MVWVSSVIPTPFNVLALRAYCRLLANLARSEGFSLRSPRTDNSQRAVDYNLWIEFLISVISCADPSRRVRGSCSENIKLQRHRKS